MALAGCSLDKQATPALAGPSELGLSLAITVTPDIITQDGSSRATVDIVARDGHSQPVRGLSLRLETAVGSVVVDVGTLSARTVTTNNDGRASAIFVSPPPPPPTAGSDSVINIIVTPVGTNYQGTFARTVTCAWRVPASSGRRTARRRPCSSSPPSSPKTGEDVRVRRLGSTDDRGIVSYVWNFGDGGSGSGQRATHAYSLPGTFQATLTVTDNGGGRDTSAPQTVTVSANTAPTAAFTFSPTPGRTGSAVSFNAAQSTAALGREIVGYEWDFGDGAPHVGGIAPFHTYTQPGTFTVTLVVTDSAGQKNAIARTITVVQAFGEASFPLEPP